MRKIYYYLIGLFLLFNTASKAQAIHACFSAGGGQTFPVTQCGGFVLPLTNCSTGTYDSAVWKLQISSNYNCTGPWGITFVTTKGGAQATAGTGYSLSVDGSYKVCLLIYNRTTGQVDSSCQCIAVVYPFPIPNFSVSDSFHCGGLTTTFTPQIQSGTTPYGPITWYFGDNLTQTTNTVSNVTHTYACKNSNPPCYSVTISVTDAHGCSKVVTKPCLVNVPCKPSATVSVTGGSACSTPTSITFHATPSGLYGHGIYSWWFPPGSTPPFTPTFGPSSSVGNVTQPFSTYGCKNVILAIKDSATGCSDTANVNNAVCIQGITVTSLSSNLNHVCCSQPFAITFNASSNPVSTPPCAIVGTLVATPVGGGATIVLGQISSTSPKTVSLPCTSSAAVTYNICFQNSTVTNLCNNCTLNYTGCLQVTVNPSPTAQINLTPPTLASYCSKGHQFCFNASTPSNNLPGCSYAWYLGSTSNTALSNTSTFCYTFPNFGTYKIYLKVCQSALNGGCCALDSIVVSQNPPTGSFIVSNTRGCDTLCAKFTVSPSTDSLYIYNFGDGTIVTSNQDTMHHCFHSNLDTCYTVTIIHIAHSLGGFVCVDTLRQKGIIKIGHKMIPSITMSPPIQCLVHKQACVYVYPNNPGLIPPTGASNSTCLSKACHWYFTKPFDPNPIVQSYVCDSPKVCFDDTGHFDAHYVIINNTCPDTVVVHNAVVINGVLGDFKDSLHCASNGTLTNFCVTIKSNIKVFPTPTNPHDSTHIKFIVNNNTCGSPTIYNFAVAPNGPPPIFNHCFCTAGSYTITMITKNSATGCPPDTTIKTITVASYHAVMNLSPISTNPIGCFVYPYGFCFTSIGSSPALPDKITWSFGDGKTLNNATAPCHTYDSCGTYIVKLRLADNSGTCSDSTQLTVALHDIYPNITASLVSPCSNCYVFHNSTVFCGGTPGTTTIHFYNIVGGATIPDIVIHGAWTSYTFCSPAVVNSALATITDSLGCIKTFNVGLPGIVGIVPCLAGVTDTVICVGATLNMSDCVTGYYVYNRAWTFSTGACNPNGTPVSTTSTYSHTFTSNGYYYVNLHQSNPFGCSSDTCVRIHVQNPIAAFKSRDTIPCPGSFDTLINKSTGAYNTLIVTMSAPSINFYQTFTYNRVIGVSNIPDTVLLPLGFPADYNICWKVISSTGCSDSVCRNLHVAGPVGHLNCSNVYVCVGDSVCCTLTTNSIGNPFVRFSDGTYEYLSYNSSGIYNFCHRYTFPGHQLVQAFIDDGAGCSYPLFDTVNVDGPIVNFSWAPYKKDFCGSANVGMLDSSIASLYPIDTSKYKWIIFNSNGSVFATYSHRNPVINISTPGSYSIMEIVKSTFGCSDTLRKSFINVYPYPIAQFNANPDTICINQCVNYLNTSINQDSVGGYKWLLNYPSASVYSTATNYQYCYATTGSFQSVLIDSSVHGCIDTSSIQTIIVLPSLTAGFTQSDDTICALSGNVFFHSTSIPNSGITWQWNFGDGSTILGPGNFPNPSHFFNMQPGSKDTCFAVKLIIRNSSGCIDSSVHYVCLSNVPTVGLIVSNKIGCSPLVTSFTDNSISLEPIASYVIDFGDGSPLYNSSTAPSAYVHSYINISHTNTATYVATYTITSLFGCKSSLTDTFIVYPVPSVSFIQDNDSLCGNAVVVNFSSTSTPNSGVNFTWNWGDATANTSGNFPSTAHVFHLPGGLGTACYPTQLTITSPHGCLDSFNHTICISSVPIAHLTIGPNASCNPLSTTFTDSSNSLVPIGNFLIDFGDASANFNSPTAPNGVTHAYSNLSHSVSAKYVANYTITTQFGCSQTIKDTFSVYPIPVACLIATDSVCPQVSTPIGCVAQAGLQYHWYHPIGSNIFSPNDTTANPNVAPAVSTTYSLAVKNQWGCVDTDSVYIFVKGLLIPYAGRDTNICAGGVVHLFAQGGLSYVWQQLSDWSIVSDSASFHIAPKVSNTYEVTISGDCNTDSVKVHVNVFPTPSVTINPTEATIIAGQKYNVTAVPSGLGLLQWHPDYNINCDTCRSVIMSPDINTTYTVVLTDVYGCIDSTEITIYVLCDKQNSIYVPNAFEPSVGASSRNAYFYVQGTGVKELTYLRVFNRWGAEVFNAEHVPINKPEAGWDGTFNGSPVGIDVYMYQMQVECSNGNLFPISGNVTIIK